MTRTVHGVYCDGQLFSVKAEKSIRLSEVARQLEGSTGHRVCRANASGK